MTLDLTGMIGGGSGGSVYIDPFTQLSDIVHGWRADLEVGTTGSAVDTWADQVGDWDLVDGGTKPTLLDSDINGQPAISFPGDGGRLLKTSGITLGLPFLIVTVFKQISWTVNDHLGWGFNQANAVSQVGSSPNLTMVNATGVNANDQFTIGTYFLGRWYYSNSTADYSQANNNTPITGANAGSSTFSGGGAFIMGVAQADFAANRAANWACAELLVLDADLTGGEETSYLAYVANRYGIS